MHIAIRRYSVSRLTSAALLLAACAVVPGCGSGTSTPTPTGGGTSPASVSSYTTTLESQIGRKLALHMHYYGWGTASATPGQSIPSFPDQAELDDATAGRTPVITAVREGEHTAC